MIEKLQTFVSLLFMLALAYCFLNLVFIAYFRHKRAYVQGLVELYKQEHKATRAESA